MNPKMLYGVVGAVVVILLVMWAVKGRGVDAPADIASTTDATTTAETVNAGNTTLTTNTQTTVVQKGALSDGAYTLSTEKSTIGWTGRKPKVLGYEDSGTLALKSGALVVTNGHIASGEFVIDMDTLKASETTNTKATLSALEGHLKSADFFDVEQYPEARFVIKNVTNGVVTGELTIKGIAKTISFPSTVVADGTSLVADAVITLNRSLWDIRYGSGSFFDDLGNNIIADEVGITLHLVATK